MSCMHCMTVSLAQGGEGLGAMWGRETAERYFRDAGFGSVEVHDCPTTRSTTSMSAGREWRMPAARGAAWS